jgi:hypothetical protein
MVVKNGALTVQVADLADAVQRVNAAISGVTGAYVAASSTTYRATDDAGVAAAQVQGRTLPPGPPIPPRPTPVPGQTASMTLKVPVDSFSDLLQRLRDIGKPLQENVSTQEVTDEYVDLDAQVRNLEATEQQYQALLQRAQKIEEILPIHQRLNDVRTQIDRLRGRMNLLQRQSDLSTITLTLVLPAKSGSEATVSGEPRVVQTLRDALARLGTILQVALDALIYVAVYALPVVPFAVAYWWWRRGRHPGAVSSAAPTGAAM